MTEKAGLNVRFGGDSDGVVEAARRGDRAVDQYGDTIDKTGRRTRQFGKESDRATSALARTGAKLATVGKAAGVAAAAIGAAAAASLDRLTKAGLESVDALAKTADKLGVTTEGLAALRRAGELTGVSQNKLDIALQRMTRRLADAAAGSGPAVDAFKALGLSANELVNLAPDEAFARIADKMNQVSNQSQKVSLAFKLFDSEGVGLVNTLALGSEGLAEVRREAELLGLTISRDVAARVEQANDSTSRTTAAFSGFGQQLAGQFAPILQGVSGKIFDVVKAHGGMEAIAKRVYNGLIAGVGVVADAFQKLHTVFLAVRAGFTSMGAVWLRVLDRIVDAMGPFVETIAKAFISLVQGIARAFETITAEAAKLAQRVSKIELLPDGVQKTLARASQSMKSLSDAAAETAKTFEISGVDIARSVGDAADSMEELADTYVNDFLAALDERSASEALKELVDNWEAAADAQAQASIQMRKDAENNATITADSITAVLDRTKDSTKEVANEFEKALQGMFERIDEGFADAWQNAFRGSFSGMKDFAKDMLGAVRNLLGEIAHLSITRPLLSGFGLGSGGFGAAGSSLVAAPGAGGVLSALFGGLESFGDRFTDLGVRFGHMFPIIDNIVKNGISNAGRLGGLFGLERGTAVGAGSLLSLGGSALLNRVIGGGTAGQVGGLVGAFSPLGPLGSFIGTAIGGLADKIFGGDGKKRFNVGVLTGTNERGDRFGESVTAASGLRLQTFVRRAGEEGLEAANQFLQTTLQLDGVLTALSQSAGIMVDFSRRSLSGVSPDAESSRGDAGAFFGARGFNGEGSLEGQADAFVRAWLDEVNDQLPRRVRQILSGVEKTAESLVAAFEAGLQIDTLIDLDVVRETELAIERLKGVQGPLIDQYDMLTERAIAIASELDGSAEGFATLAAAMTDQKNIALELALAYKAVGQEIEGRLTSTIDFVRESVLSDEELYARRRQQVADLINQIGSTVDPVALNDIGARIDALTRSAFGLLDENQQQSLSPEFASFLTTANDLLQRQLNTGLDSLGQREEGVSRSIDLEIANLQSGAANTQLQAAQLNLQTAELTAQQQAQIAQILSNLQGFGGIIIPSEVTV